jgi:hypothetical protein
MSPKASARLVSLQLALLLSTSSLIAVSKPVSARPKPSVQATKPSKSALKLETPPTNPFTGILRGLLAQETLKQIGVDPATPPAPPRKEIEQKTPAGELLLIRAEKFRRDGKVLYCEGNVTVEIAGIRLDSQQLIYDSETGLAKGRKDCVFFWGDNFAASQEVDLDTKTKRAVMRKVAGRGSELVTSGKQLEEPMFFYADELRWTPEKAELTHAVLTTCDEVPQDWHYKIEASKIDIYPRDHLDATGSAITLGDRRLFTLPTISFSLDPNRSIWQDFIPTFGYSGIFGAFARFRVPYHIDPRNYGKVLLDFYSKTGIAGGLEHQFSLGDRGGGNFYFYKQGGVQSAAGRLDLRANVGYQLDDFTNIGFAYGQNQFELPGLVSPTNIGTSFAISRYAPGSAFQFSSNFSRSGDNTNTGYRAFYETDLNERTSILLSGDYALASTLFARTQRSHYLVSVTHRGDWFDADLAAENTGGQNTFFLNRNPEFRFRTHPLYLGQVPILASLNFGDITESPSNCRSTRGDFRLTVPDQTMDWGSGRASVGGGFKQFFYGTGDDLRVLTARSTVMQNLSDTTLARLDFNYQSPTGTTPFLSDVHYNYQTVTAGMEFYNAGQFKLAAYGGYDFFRNTPHDIIARADYALGPGWNFSTGTNFDPNAGQFRSVDNQLSVQLTDNIFVSHWSVYDFEQQKLSYQDFIVNFAEHDWDASIAYRGVQNEVFFQLSLKAFPSPRIQIGPNTSAPVLPQNLPNAFIRDSVP